MSTQPTNQPLSPSQMLAEARRGRTKMMTKMCSKAIRMIGNTPIVAVANMSLHQQILFGQLTLCPVCCHPFLIAPVARQREAVKAIDNIANGRFQLLCCEMAAVDMGDLIGVENTSQMAGHLVRT
jgi:hypothetical protein